MQPGIYPLTITENSTNAWSFVISGITTAVGYTAAVDIRKSEVPTSTRLLGLTNGSGLSLSSNGSALTVVLRITEAQADTLVPLLSPTAVWSLKITAPDGSTLQYLKGPVVGIRTPTT